MKTWHGKIQKFLEQDGTILPIGERTISWIASFKEDLRGWKFPVKLVIENPVIVSGKILVALVKKQLTPPTQENKS